MALAEWLTMRNVAMLFAFILAEFEWTMMDALSSMRSAVVFKHIVQDRALLWHHRGGGRPPVRGIMLRMPTIALLRQG
jgi:hypothetical protein